MPLIRAEFLRPHQLGRTVLIHDISQVLYLPFDYDDGSYARDRSGRVNHGTIYGASKAAGKIGGALSFDGVDDYMKVLNAPSLNPANALSIVFWFKIDILPTAYFQFVRKENQFSCRVNSPAEGNKIDGHVRLSDGSWEPRVETTWVPSTGVWYHYALAWNGTLLTLYINGNRESQVTRSGVIDPTGNDVFVCSTGGADNFVDGIIDEVRIYNRALSAAEIVRVMNLRGI